MFTHFQSLVHQLKILNHIVSQSNLKITVVLYYFKFHCFGFRNSNTPYYLLSHNIIVCPIVSRKCFFIFILLFLSGDIQLNPGLVSLNNQHVSSPLDVYEPFLSPTAPNLRIATLNFRSVLNKSAIINNRILENKIDILRIIETWINDGQFKNLLSSSLLPSNYVLLQYYKIMAGLIRSMMVVLLILTRNLFIILLYPFLFFPY